MTQERVAEIIVETPVADVRPAPTEAFQHDGTALIDAAVNRPELSMPGDNFPRFLQSSRIEYS
jgi:hypothetical protein